jgi:hypothetical protein
MFLFYLVVALSAFLLFLVQPIIAKQILPWFGGSAAVWSTSLVFFQSALLAGYAYADFSTNKLNGKRQAFVHIGFACLALIVLPIIPGAQWRPTGDDAPMLKILLLLTVVIGLPYVLLSTTSPLVQSWFARAYPGRDPYRLFAVSNTASLIALVGYPFLLEPNAGTKQQATLWSALFVLFVLAVSALAWRMSRVSFPHESAAGVSENASIPPAKLEANNSNLPRNVGSFWGWLFLSATGSVMLLAVTNHLSHNIPSVPLMWLAPLTIYLITFILTFDGRGWYSRVAFAGPVVIALAAMGYLLVDKEYQFDLQIQSIVFCLGLFVCCMMLHGELVASKPDASQLTRFYLCVSIGGALGSVLVGFVAPFVLPGFYEMTIALVFVALALVWVARQYAPPLLQTASLLAVGGTLAAVYLQIDKDRNNLLSASRNFYGVLKVKEYGDKGTDGHFLRLVHGAILHGEQYTSDKWRKSPSTYYTATSGLGLITQAKQANSAPVRLGMVGLGVGTYAAYGRAGDSMRFYEIDPEVITVAREKFFYLKESGASIEMSLGDARLSLERESAHAFDVLAIDAFSSDSIPTHLITMEAIAVYLRHLKPDGVLAFHVSNRFLNLPPVLEKLAKANQMQAVMVEDPAQEDNGLHSSSTWVLLARNSQPFVPLAGKVQALPEEPTWQLWTDDYNNLVQVLKSND